MKGRGAKKGFVLATVIVFMLIIVALSVLVLSLASATVRTANIAQNNADVRIALDAAGNEFLALIASDYDKQPLKETDSSGETETTAATESTSETTTTTTSKAVESSSSPGETTQAVKETEKEPTVKLNGKEEIEKRIQKCLDGVGKDKYECTVNITGSAEQIITLIVRENKTGKCVLFVSAKRTVSGTGDDITTKVSMLRWSEEFVASDVTEEELEKFKAKFMSLAEEESSDSGLEKSAIIMTGLAAYIRGGADGASGMFEDFGKYYTVNKLTGEREYSASDPISGDVVFTYKISYSKDESKGYMPTLTVSNPAGEELLSVTVKIVDGKAVEVLKI